MSQIKKTTTNIPVMFRMFWTAGMWCITSPGSVCLKRWTHRLRDEKEPLVTIQLWDALCFSVGAAVYELLHLIIFSVTGLNLISSTWSEQSVLPLLFLKNLISVNDVAPRHLCSHRYGRCHAMSCWCCWEEFFFVLFFKLKRSIFEDKRFRSTSDLESVIFYKDHCSSTCGF